MKIKVPGKQVSITTFRDGGTKALRVGEKTLFFDNSIGSPVRGRGLFNMWPTQVAVSNTGFVSSPAMISKEDHKAVCAEFKEALQSATFNNAYEQDSAAYMLKRLEAFEQDYDSAYKVVT